MIGDFEPPVFAQEGFEGFRQLTLTSYKFLKFLNSVKPEDAPHLQGTKASGQTESPILVRKKEMDTEAPKCTTITALISRNYSHPVIDDVIRVLMLEIERISGEGCCKGLAISDPQKAAWVGYEEPFAHTDIEGICELKGVKFIISLFSKNDKKICKPGRLPSSNGILDKRRHFQRKPHPHETTL